MNEPRYEVFPERVPATRADVGDGTRPTGQFCWHFKDANGKITHVGGESFSRRGDAHRSIRGVVADDCSLALKFHVPVHSISIDHAIVDLDENGDVISTP
jgi:hypothetical protein